MGEINIRTINAGRDVNVSQGSETELDWLRDLTAEQKGKILEIEGKLKILDKEKDKTLITGLLNSAKNISVRVAETLAVRFLIG